MHKTRSEIATLDAEVQRVDSIEASRRTGLLVRVWRRRSLFALVFCTVMGIAVAALLLLPVRYLATGSIIVAEQEPGIHSSSEAWTQKLGDPADLESQLLVIRSPRMLRLAMASPGAIEAVQEECRYSRAHGLMGWLARLLTASCDKLKPDSNALIEYVDGRYRVGAVGRSRVFSISYLSPLPGVARKLANVLTTVFLDDQRANASTGREAAAGWLWKELRQLDSEVREQDAKIQAFRRDKGLTRGTYAPISSERLTSMSQQLSAAEAARAEAAARLKEIATDPANAPVVLASRTIADLKLQISAASAQLASTANVLGPRHPALRALQQERDTLQQRLDREVAVIAASAKKNYEAANALAASLKQQMEALKGEFASAAADETSIESMVRSAEIKRQEYADLYKRASELESERRLLIGNTRLVSLAELPTKPFFPRPIPFLAGGFTVATLLAFGAALLRDRSDRSVRASSDLAEMTGAPIFAHLPQVTNGWKPPVLSFFSAQRADIPLTLALKEAKRDPVLQDALRKLYAGLVLAGSERMRSILVTSTGPREGKTFTTLALAQLVAATGRRVLAVECDMRNPSFAAALALPRGPGLESFLKGHSSIEQAVVPTAIPNLDAIPAGGATTDSTELLMGSQLPKLLRWAESYDLVLFDSPPSAVMMDACMLAKHVDGVLCCTRWGYSSLAGTAATIGFIRAAGGDVFGTAVTMVKSDDHALYESAPTSPALAELGAS